MNEELCGHCGKVIAVNEQANVNQGMIVCSKCDRLLRNVDKAVGIKKWWKSFTVILFCIIFLALSAYLYNKYTQDSMSHIQLSENTLGNSRVVIGPSGNRAVLSSICVSPDGNRVAIFEPDGLSIDGREIEWKRALKVPYQNSPSFAFSPDSQRYAYIAESENRQFVVLDGEPQTRHEAFKCYGLIFSPNSKRTAYVSVSEGRKDPDGVIKRSYRLVVDGDTECETDKWIGDIVFSPDSRYVAYTLYKLIRPYSGGSKPIVVLGEFKSQEYDHVYELQFLPASNALVYVAEQSQRFFMVINDVRGSLYDSIGRGYPVISPDGARYAYAAKKGQRWLMVIDGVESEEFDGIGKAIFSPDSQHVMFSSIRNDKHYVVIDGDIGPEYDEVGALIYSPNSRKTAFSAKQGDKHIVVVDRIIQGEYGGTIHDMTFSPDSKRFTYLAEANQKVFLVLDGTRQEGKFDGASSLTFSPDSKRLAFCSSMGMQSVTLQEEDYDIVGEAPKTADLRSVEWEEIKTINEQGRKKLDQLSPLSQVVVDGIREQEYCAAGFYLTFSPDSKHYVYWANKDEQWVLVINGREIQKYHRLYSGIIFDSRTRFHTHGLKDGKVVRIDVYLEPQTNSEKSEDSKSLSIEAKPISVASDTPQPDSNSPVVNVNGSVYTYGDLEKRLQQIIAYTHTGIRFYPISFLNSKNEKLLFLIKIKNDTDSYPASFLKEREKELHRIILDHLVADHLLSEEAKKEGITVSEEEFKAKLAQHMPEMKIDSITQQLLTSGYDSSIVLNDLRNAVAHEMLFERKWEGKIDVTQQKIEYYYQLNKKDFTSQGRIRFFAEVADSIERILIRQEQDKIREAYTESLKAAADIQYPAKK